jgi:hypothetical protein
MEQKNHSNAVPENQSGDSVDAESVRNCADAEEANALFSRAKARLLNVNSWHEFAGDLLAHFTLMDKAGNQVQGPAREGLFIRIDIPGPGTKAADGFDWVIVEEHKEEEQPDGVSSVALRVRPTADPTSAGEDTAHFYSRESTSTFTLSKNGLKVSAGVYDRNLAPNQESSTWFDKLRNAVIGFVGEKAFSAVQWKAFTDGILAD